VRLRARAPGKVNLCLFLGGPRGDGRHELVTLFESVSVADELLMSVSSAGRDEVACAGVEGPNLALGALAGLRERGWGAPAVRVEIEKRIPIAGGMAGGSADAAAVLRMATELAPGRPEEVATIATLLGADVPSQLAPGLVLGTGAGEIIEPVPAIAPHALVIVPQPSRLSTAEVYREADRLGLPRGPEQLEALLHALRSALAEGQGLAPELLANDLEPAAVSLCPGIFLALEGIRVTGADKAFVCGSGPTTAGLYWGHDGVERAIAAAESLVKQFPEAISAVPVTAEYGSPEFA
jgi:4-diphosphocytidyl-2-C-methyl-D-erythritol kinase